VISGEIVSKGVKYFEYRPAFLLILLVLSLMWLYADQNLVAPLLTTMAADRMIPGIRPDCNVTDPGRVIDACATTEFFYYAGLLGTIPTLSGILTTFVWGYLADKLSRRLLFALAVLVGEIPCFLTGFARSYYELLALRALTGIGINGSAPVARALVADVYSPEERGKGYAIYYFSTGLGILLGMVMAGIVVSMGMSWRTPFMLAAAPNFLLVPLFLLTVKEIKMGFAEPELRRLYESGLEYRYRINLREFKAALLTTTTLIFMYLQGIPGTLPWGGLSYWVPTYLQKQWGLNVAAVTVVIFVAGLGMIVGTVIAGLLTDRMLGKGYVNARLLIPFIGILIGAATTIALLSYPYPYGDSSLNALAPVIVMVLLGTIFIPFASPNVLAILSEVTLPEHRGTVFGIFNVTDYIGSAIAPLLAGALIASLGGMYQGLVATALFWIPCALLWLPAFRTYRRDKEKLRRILAERAQEEQR